MKRLLALPKEEYLKLIEDCSDTIIITDTKGKIIIWNEGAGEILGYTQEDVLGRNIDMLYKDRSSRKVADMRRTVLNGGKVVNAQIKELRKDGKQLMMLLSVIPLRDREGKIKWIARIGKDITLLKELNRKALKQREFEAVHDMVVALNHEMNQPLAIIKGSLDLMQMRLEKGRNIDIDEIDRINRNVDRLAKLIQDVGDIRKLKKVPYLDNIKMIAIRKKGNQS